MSLALAFLLLGAQADGPPPGDSPRGTSGEASRYDEVGYAGRADGPGAAIATSAVPAGSIVEVTAIDTGKVVLLAVTNGASGKGHLADLTPAAAAALGIGERAPVRVRVVHVAAGEEAAIRAGHPGVRLEAPPALLAGLGAKLKGGPVAATPRPEPAAVMKRPELKPAIADKHMTKPTKADLPKPKSASVIKPTPPAAPPAHGTFVQVAAVSDKARAEALAGTVHGFVQPAGKAYRVRLGPFADARAAQHARDGVAARGYRDARLVRED